MALEALLLPPKHRVARVFLEEEEAHQHRAATARLRLALGDEVDTSVQNEKLFDKEYTYYYCLFVQRRDAVYLIISVSPTADLGSGR